MKISNEMIKEVEKNKYYNVEMFEKDCNAYIEAVKSGRILYNVEHVSASGMSRKITIKSFEGTMEKGYYRNYFAMLEIFGYKMNKDYTITVKGCGMNMLFATNYDLINQMFKMELLDKETCDTLAQNIN